MLPVSFHQTFIPERRYIAALLDYAALGQQGSYQDIAEVTGIPMGKYSGKVPAIIKYAQGMGLIELASIKGSRNKKPLLTPLGKIVYMEDKFLGEPMVQWLVHMNLCRSDIGAEAWHVAFARGRHILGASFLRNQLQNFLIDAFGAGKDRIGPMLQTYTEDAALARAGVLALEGEKIIRKKAPLLDAWVIPYAAYILDLLEVFFPGQNQVTFSDFNTITYWFDICLWSMLDVELILTQVEHRGYISIDRQMQPWIIEKRKAAADVWPHIFDDMA